MRVIVTGLVATYPIGGVAWDYLQYLRGFEALGCDVWYLEDTGQWLYDPAAGTFTADARGGMEALVASLGAVVPRLASQWALRAPDGVVHGLTEERLAEVCAGTDLLLNLSGACWLREPYRAARVKAYVDTDPGYTQAKISAVDDGIADESTRFSVDLIRRHDVFFSLAEHLGRPDCLIPTCGLTWHATRQPIALDAWPVTAAPDGAFTTVMSWKIEPSPPRLGGRVYGGKDVEFERFLDLPQHTPEVLEVALSGDAPRDRIAAAGWRVRGGRDVSGTLSAYRDYLSGSRGEFSIAKNAYVATRSGWFSTRSAAYLACGKPIVVQDTGFPAHVPVGPGVHAFQTRDDAVEALAAIRADYPRACRHARETAETFFDAAAVCARLLSDAGF